MVAIIAGTGAFAADILLVWKEAYRVLSPRA
ncbi:unnamed protein product, partial [marine sediment metagenome]